MQPKHKRQTIFDARFVGSIPHVGDYFFDLWTNGRHVWVVDHYGTHGKYSLADLKHFAKNGVLWAAKAMKILRDPSVSPNAA